jgi:hypothetical protein
MQTLRSKALPTAIVALVLGLVLGGGAVAAMTIAPHSIGWNKLAPGLQHRIEARSYSPAATGPTGPQGEAGPQGPPGRDGKDAEPPEEPEPPEAAKR